MPPTYNPARAREFISVVFDIVVESLNNAMPNNENINNLLAQAALIIEENGSVDSLFEQLALEINKDPETLAMIHMNLNEYKRRIRAALENNQIRFEDGDF